MRQYEVTKYRYVVSFIEKVKGFGKCIACYEAFDAEDLAEQFFKDYKNVDYKIVSKTGFRTVIEG